MDVQSDWWETFFQGVEPCESDGDAGGHARVRDSCAQDPGSTCPSGLQLGGL